IDIFIWILVLLFCFQIASAQTSDYIYRQFTTKKGLPSNECHEVYQDSRGYLWVGTDNGLVRYDGYEFKRYGNRQGLGEPVIFEIKEDVNGSIWVAGLSGKVYIYRPNKDRFYPYKYQHIIDKELVPNFPRFISNFNIIHGTLEIPIATKGLLHIDNNGNSHFIYHTINTTKTYAFWSATNWGYELPFLQLNYTNDIRTYEIVKEGEVVFNWIQRYDSIFSFSNFAGAIFNNTIIINSDGKLRIIHQDLIFSEGNLRVGEISCTKNERPVLCCLENKGVRLYHRLQPAEYSHIMKDISATGFIEDSDGGYWITSLRHGLFYIPNPDIKNVDLQDQTVSNLLVMNDSLYANTTEGNIYQVKPEFEQLDSGLGPHARLISSDDNSSILWNKNDISILYNLHSKDKQSIVGNPILNFISWKNKTIALNQVGSLFQLDNILSYNGDHTPQKIGRVIERPNRMIASNNYLFIGGINGLIRADLDCLSQWDKINAYNGIRIEDITLKGEKLILGTKGSGISIYDTKKNEPDFITTDDGLIDDHIEQIFLGNNGDIWAATQSGISQLKYTDTLDKPIIKNYNTSHGLPTPDIYDITEYSGNIMVATGYGIIQLMPTKKNVVSNPPKILYVRTGHDTLNRQSPIIVAHDQNNFDISYLSINFRHAAMMKYRYSIDGYSWIETFNRIANLVDLPSGTHLFEVQSQNEDGIWSNSTIIPIKIRPAWWQTWWFYSIVIILSSVLISLLYKNRVRQINARHEIEKEIRFLEKSALQSQMNPHFIFNCLNSIQSFIIQNDKEQAMEYLGMFASLIRQYLRASNSTFITLYDECQMLRNYLELESLRCNYSFEYSINHDLELDLLSIQIPPMMIQPFVENAIKHGMKSKKKGEGKIEINFRKSFNALEVIINDNGPGINYEAQNKGIHDSLGMQITRKRMQFIKETLENENNMHIYSDTNGTEIILLIAI
nr:histidine kinase [Saprospiraceae bacterium]